MPARLPQALDWANWTLTILGLVIIAWGAYITARAVILDEATARALSGTYYDGNRALLAALLEQSTAAKHGLFMIMGGSVLQIVAVVAQVARAFVAVPPQ